MPYDIKNYKGTSVASVAEGTVNSQTPLKLVGQNYKNYGSLIAENFVHLIENFSRDVEPTNAMLGQLWYKPADGLIYIYDQDSAGNKKWKSLANLEVSTVAPGSTGGYDPKEGDLWFDNSADKGILNIRYKDSTTGNLSWAQLSVPVSSKSTLLFQNVNDNTSDPNTAPKEHATIKFVVDNKVLAILSSDDIPWTPHNKVQTVTPGSGGASVVYGFETHPDGTNLANEFPLIQTGLTLAQPYDPDTTGGTATPGFEYPLKFSAPAAGGTPAEGYPMIAADGTIASFVITNKGSGYDQSSVDATIDKGQNGSTAADLQVTLGAAGTDDEDKVATVIVNSNSPGDGGYLSPPRKPTLNGSIRVGAADKDFIDLRGVSSGFGRKIIGCEVLNGGTGFTVNDQVGFSNTNAGTEAVLQVAEITGGGSTGPIKSMKVISNGEGYTFAPSTGNSTMSAAFGTGSGAALLAVLGDNRMIMDPDAISGDKIHAGNISAFESSAISDLTNWKQNDPGIAGLTLNDGQDAGYGGKALGGSDNTLNDYTQHTGGGTNGEYDAANSGTLTTDANSTSAVKRLAGYVEVAFERDQTLGSSNTTQAANGALRVKGGAHIHKNLHVDGSISVKGSILSFGGLTNIETTQLRVEDNLIELNKSQSSMSSATPFAGVAGLYVDRGMSSGSNHVKKSLMLWDDGLDSFGQTDGTAEGNNGYWKFGLVGDGATSTGITESTDGDTVDNPSIDAVSHTGTDAFALWNVDVKQLQASHGTKADVISDGRTRDGLNSSIDRSKGGVVTKYNGFDQDTVDQYYPHTSDQDLILVDQDERIMRGEFHFYRDAYPCDGSDMNGTSGIFPGTNMTQGGVSTTGVSTSLITLAKGANNVTANTATYITNSGGPNKTSDPTTGGSITVASNQITVAAQTIAAKGFLDDPVYLVQGGNGVVAHFREGRSIGWQRPRIVIDDSTGTGGYAVQGVGVDGTLDGNPTTFTKGKNYSGSVKAVVIGESNDQDVGVASGGYYTVSTPVSGTITTNTSTDASVFTKAGTTVNFRKEKPFKEINATRHNGVFCADPAQASGTPAELRLEKSPGNYRSSSESSAGAIANDSLNKFVGAYPIMDGHNAHDITSGTFPYNGGGMTLGTQHNHFIDTYTRNIRVENPLGTTEELTILSRNTHASSTSSHAKVNVVATNSGTHGKGTVLIRAQSGTTGASGVDSNVTTESLATGTGGKANTTITSSTAGGAASESNIYIKATGSASTTGTDNVYPYGQRTDVGDTDLGSKVAAKAGNEVHIQATNMVVIEAPHATGRSEAVGTGSVERLEVDATDTFINGHIHLGNVVANTTNDHSFSHNVYFNADVGSHVFPNEDASGTATSTMSSGYDLGATTYKKAVGELTDNLTTDTSDTTDRRWRTIYVRNISAGANDQTGTITGDWSLTAGSTFQATYTADLAERYEADEVLEPGTVVAMGGDKEITATTKENDAEAFGVISTEPGFLLNGAAGDDTTHPKVAMVGRVPCKVKGKINKGDRLVSSSTKGRARKADLTKDSVFAIIGRALESHDSSGEGTIEIAVTRN